MCITELRTALEEREEIDIVELATLLLRLCRSEIRALHDALLLPSNMARRVELRERADEWFKRIDDETLDQSELSCFLQIVEEEASALDHPIVAIRAWAEGLDATLGERRFAGMFRNRVADLNENDAFPVLHPDLKGIYGRLTSNPDTITPPLDGLKHLRLVPADLGRFSVVLDATLDDQLATLTRGSTIATVVPSPDLSSHYEWDTYEIAQQGLFYNVRPKAPESQIDVIKTLLKEIDAAGAKVAVLPELSICEADVGGLETFFEDSLENLVLLVAGSSHLPREGDKPGFNESRIMVRGSQPNSSHTKFTRFEYVESAKDGGRRLTEHIGGSSKLTVYCSGAWSFAVLICKDLLEEPVVQILSSLRVRLALVPALSAKTDHFEQRADQLACNSQALVAIANTPADAKAAATIFAAPTRRNARLSIHGLHDAGEPCAFLLKLGGQVRRVPLPS